MSITARPGSTFEATLSVAPTGLAGTIGVQILDNAGGVSVSRVTAGIFEFPAGSGLYGVMLTAPTVAGQYTVLWDTGTISPSTTATEDLVVSSTAGAVALPSGADLCTLADVRELMQDTVTDTSQDTLTSHLITRASRAVSLWTEREFAPQTNGLARVFEWPWESTYLSLAPYDARSISLVVVDTDQASPITLSTDEWHTWPRPRRDGTIMALRLSPFGAATGRVIWRNREVTVTGDWGFPSIPEDVVHATAATVVHMLSVNTAVGRRPDEDPALTPPRRGIPPEACQMLAPYKRAVMG